MDFNQVGLLGETYALAQLPELFPGAIVHGVSGNLVNNGQFMGNNEALVDIVMLHEGIVYMVEVSATAYAHNDAWCGLKKRQIALAAKLTAALEPVLTEELAEEMRLPAHVWEGRLGMPVAYLVVRVVLGAKPHVAFTLPDPALMVEEGGLVLENNGTWLRCSPVQADPLAGLMAALAV